MMDHPDLPSSKHFSIQPLAEGVFAVIARFGGSAICNAGIIDLGGTSLIFDTFVCPSAAEELHLSAVNLLGHEPDFVINSHYHNDHIWGNQVFSPPAHIISSKQTYKLISTAGIQEFEEEKAGAAQTLSHFRELYQKADTDAKRAEAELMIGEYEGIVRDLPGLMVRMPDIFFDSRLSFKGSRRQAELIAFEHCHTGNDAVLFLPGDGIIFMGDLLFVGCHPYLGDGDAVNWAKTVNELRGFGATRFVPGHGEVGGLEDMGLIGEYIESCLNTAQTLVRAGKADKEAIAELQVPEKFRNWKISMFYSTNLRALCKRLV